MHVSIDTILRSHTDETAVGNVGVFVLDVLSGHSAVLRMSGIVSYGTNASQWRLERTVCVISWWWATRTRKHKAVFLAYVL